MKRGWCPTLDRPMASGDGLLVRVNPPGAALSPDQARALAAAARAHGNGVMELTQRGNVQVRGLSDGSAGRFAAAMRAVGLALPPAIEARRRVMVPPLLGVDPSLGPGVAALTAALERACQVDARLAGLPAKFAIHVDGGGVLGFRAASATMTVRPDGSVGPGGRSGTLAGALGYGGGRQAYALGAPFGQFDADMLEAAAALAGRHGTDLRVTPWRAVVLGCVAVAADIGPAGTAGWIVAAGDARLRVATCVGAPGCLRGTTATRADAAVVAARVAARLSEGDGPVHVSGCAKGCAHGGVAATLVAREGLYDVVPWGRAGDAPSRSGLTLEEGMLGLGL